MSRVLAVLGLLVGAYLAVVLLAWVFQRKLIYMPMGTVPRVEAALPGAEAVHFETEDGLSLGGWFLGPRNGTPVATVLVLNGNAGNRSYRAPLAEALAGWGFATFLFDYRGFGGNPGSPSESGLLQDARAARTYLESRPDVDATRIVLFGESLGAAVAVAAAAERLPPALILRSPFASLAGMGKIHYPFLPVDALLRDRFPSTERIRSVTCPLLVIAGDRDAIVPESESRKLFDAAPGQTKRFALLQGAAHNDLELLAGPRMIKAITDFLAISLPPS